MEEKWETEWEEPHYDEIERREYELRALIQRCKDELGYVYTSEIIEEEMKKRFCRG